MCDISYYELFGVEIPFLIGGELARNEIIEKAIKEKRAVVLLFSEERVKLGTNMYAYEYILEGDPIPKGYKITEIYKSKILQTIIV